MDKFDEFSKRITEAAVQAEMATGVKESTEAEAKSHALVRMGRMALGIAILLLGIALLPLPGPGWMVISGGLFILSKDVAWADRLLRYVRKRVPGVPEDGRIPRSSIITMVTITLGAVALSIWFAFGRG